MKRAVLAALALVTAAWTSPSDITIVSTPAGTAALQVSGRIIPVPRDTWVAGPFAGVEYPTDVPLPTRAEYMRTLNFGDNEWNVTPDNHVLIDILEPPAVETVSWRFPSDLAGGAWEVLGFACRKAAMFYLA